MMKIAEMNARDLARPRYTSPEVKVVKTRPHIVLCQSGSGSISGLNGKDDDPSVWE